MPVDAEREACLAMAIDMARTGTFEDHAEVVQAISLGEGGIWHDCRRALPARGSDGEAQRLMEAWAVVLREQANGEGFAS